MHVRHYTISILVFISVVYYASGSQSGTWRRGQWHLAFLSLQRAHWVKINDCGKEFHRHTQVYVYIILRDVYVYLSMCMLACGIPPAINYFHGVSKNTFRYFLILLR